MKFDNIKIHLHNSFELKKSDNDHLFNSAYWTFHDKAVLIDEEILFSGGLDMT